MMRWRIYKTPAQLCSKNFISATQSADSADLQETYIFHNQLKLLSHMYVLECFLTLLCEIYYFVKNLKFRGCSRATIRLSMYRPIYLSIYLSFYGPIYEFIYRSTYLSISAMLKLVFHRRIAFFSTLGWPFPSQHP